MACGACIQCDECPSAKVVNHTLRQKGNVSANGYLRPTQTDGAGWTERGYCRNRGGCQLFRSGTWTHLLFPFCDATIRN